MIAILSVETAKTTSSSSGGGLASLALPALLFVAMYFVLIRPNRRKMKEANARAAALMASLQVGDEVVLTSGVYGFVSLLEDEVVWLDIADGHEKERIEIRVDRSAVARKIVQSGEADSTAKQ